MKKKQKQEQINEANVRFNQQGLIKEGYWEGFYVWIEDNRITRKCYDVYFSESPTLDKSFDFDNWVPQHEWDLYLAEAGWQIEWLP